jgi:hypothetical protein
MPMRAESGKAWWLLWKPSPNEIQPNTSEFEPCSVAPGSSKRRSPFAWVQKPMNQCPRIEAATRATPHTTAVRQSNSDHRAA